LALLAAVGGLSFVLASLVVGLRLLWLARRTRELPELAIGLGLVLMGGLGYPLTATARLATAWPDALRSGLFLVSMLFAWIGIVGVCVFNQRVFRAGSRGARWLVAGIAAGQALCLVAQAVHPGLRAAALYNEGLGLRLFTAGHGLPLAWAAYESFRYGAALARRARLGLADPVVVDRLRLWGISMAAALSINLASSIAGFHGVDIAATPGGALVIAPLGLAAAGCTWLAFLPPAAYLRRVAARAAASGSAPA
jgi:hypothetical protein